MKGWKKVKGGCFVLLELSVAPSTVDVVPSSGFYRQLSLADFRSNRQPKDKHHIKSLIQIHNMFGE